MGQLLEIPPGRLSGEVLDALLEEFASRDGTDYGERELTLAQKTASLRQQLAQGSLLLMYDVETEGWDIVEREQGRRLLRE